MKCLVTAGPTFEPLDEVRRLTNFSTGRLGSELAAFLSRRGNKVTLLRGEQATWTQPVNAAIIPFTTTRDLRERLKAAAAENFDAVFHAAAVSDFTFGRIWERSAGGDAIPVKAGKISSRQENLFVELAPTPKIISELRDWYPRAVLVGWKFEVDGNRDSVLAKARKQIEENRTDACVANGPAYGEGFGLVSATAQHCGTREELLEQLLQLIRRPRAG